MPRRRSLDIMDIAEARYQADELKLTMDNEGRIYDRLNMLRAATTSVACLSGRYDVEKASNVFDTIVAEEARRYTKEFGVKFSKTSKREVAREYARETKAAVNLCFRDSKMCTDLPKVVQDAVKRCAIPPGGQLARSRRRRAP